MDWADDTAYSLNDLVDSANAGFVTGDRIAPLGGRAGSGRAPTARPSRTWCEAMATGDLERSMNRKIGDLRRGLHAWSSARTS